MPAPVCSPAGAGFPISTGSLTKSNVSVEQMVTESGYSVQNVTGKEQEGTGMTSSHTNPSTEDQADPGIEGPVCEGSAEFGGCDHDSCQSIEANGRIHLAVGPVCGGLYYQGGCDHGSCEAIEPAQSYCARHGWQLITESGSGSGFAGGRVLWASLACGCTETDESDDIRAAY